MGRAFGADHNALYWCDAAGVRPRPRQQARISRDPISNPNQANALMKLNAKILDPRLGRDFPLLEPATAGSAGVDLRAMMNPLLGRASDSCTHRFIRHIADPGWCAMLMPRLGKVTNVD